MQVQVSGKQVDVGEALGSRISQELEDGVGKYFARGGDDAEVVVSKDGHNFKVDCWVRLASGQTLVTTGFGGDAHSAFTESLDKLEKRVRRYKRRLKDHHIGPKGLSPEKTEDAAREVARSIVLRDPDTVEDEDFGDEIQVLLTDGPTEMGLWYRLAPVTYLGGTLGGDDAAARHPFEPAALGSAIVHGPHTARFATEWQQLGGAGAAADVADRGGYRVR